MRNLKKNITLVYSHHDENKVTEIVSKLTIEKNIILGKCYVGQNRGRQKSSFTFSNKQGNLY